MRRVLLSPHLDDAVLSCLGAISAGSTVVSVFAGVPRSASLLTEWDARCGAQSSQALARRRIQEDLRALAVAGARPVHLPFLEHQYRDRHVPQAGLAERLRAELDGAGEVWVPAAVCAHPDHWAVRGIALAVLATQPATIWLYADYPYHQYLVRSVASARAGGTTAYALNDWFAQQLKRGRDGPRRRLHAHVLTEEALAVKKSAVRCYESQLEALGAGLGGRPLDDDELLRTEYSWCLRGTPPQDCCAVAGRTSRPGTAPAGKASRAGSGGEA